MKTVRYGIIGLGNQGSTYIKEFFNPGKVENAEITALCDINPDKIALAKEYTQGRKIAFFTDYKAMLKSGLIDAAMVETPHYYHRAGVFETRHSRACGKARGRVCEAGERNERNRRKVGRDFRNDV